MSKKYPINVQGLSTEAKPPVGRFADSQPWAEAIANIHQLNVGGGKKPSIVVHVIPVEE